MFTGRGHTNDLNHCPICRATRKIQRGETGGNSIEYPRTRQEMFPATCASCGKDTRVPFRPRNGRSVYCSSCYSRVRAH
ncbi:CxxC-x17-CxxC domain-containing protein [Chloroflexota bacterium]